MTEVLYGTINLPNIIDITDPCYNKDVWCRINNFPIPAGEYECYTLIANNEETGGWGERVARIGIRKGKAMRYEQKGTIGVDAGLAGFFNNKPDYNDEEWQEFCETIRTGNAWLTPNGFFSSSGYGDGSYKVYAGYNNRELVEVYIEFITEEDLYEEYEYEEDEYDEDEEYSQSYV